MSYFIPISEEHFVVLLQYSANEVDFFKIIIILKKKKTLNSKKSKFEEKNFE